MTFERFYTQEKRPGPVGEPAGPALLVLQQDLFTSASQFGHPKQDFTV